MSRHGFFKVMHDPTENQEDLTDLIGYDLYDWLSHGVVGYDEPLGTFFFNLEGSWIFGIEGEEIPTIGLLQAILSAVFRGAELPFNQEGLRTIAEEVEGSPAVLSPAEAADLSNSVSASYLEERVALANYFRGEPEAATLRSDAEDSASAPEAASEPAEAPDKPKRGFLSKALHSLFTNR
ncbi:hypothetical protein ACPF7Z_08665 [Halomonas sp. GXIMD04776]|uniref:hypothetical protein n=1 Tax=Halomonas sp. GXIMD04776 TaxID=3415605 RepID=UPI003CB7E791